MELPNISKYQTKKTLLNERQTLIKVFLDELNKDRGKYPTLKASRVAMMLAPIKTKDLYSFLADCRYAKCFGSFYWSRFKK